MLPSGVSRVRAFARAAIGAHATNTAIFIHIYKNGSPLAPAAFATEYMANASPTPQVISQSFAVAAADVVTARLETTDTSINIFANSYLEVEVLQ